MYDAQLESTIAKILFHNPDLIDTELVDKDDFFTDTKHAINRMTKLRKNGNLLNETTVGTRFETPSEIETEQFEEFVYALKSLNKERKLSTLGNQVIEISTEAYSYEDKWMKIRKLMDNFEDTTVKVDDYLLANTLEAYKEKLFSKSTEDLLATGIYELDLKCGKGFKAGELILLAGEPGGYKSTLMYNIALNVALRGDPVMLFTYEVSVDEIHEILASMLAEVDSLALRGRAYEQSDIIKLQKAFKIVEKLPIHVVDSNATMNNIKMMAYQKKPKLVLVDYLQIMPDIGMDAMRSLEFVSRQLKLMANPSILNCPIIAISQFSRASTDSEGKQVERKMSDLKWSSSLEQNAATIMFCEHVFKNTRAGSKDFIKIKIVKNRHGINAEMELPLIPKYHKIDANYVSNKEFKRT